MTSIFPGGNALNAANITKKQQDQSAALMEKISNGKRLITGADDAGNINKVNNLKAKVLSTKAAVRSVTDMMSMAQLADQGYNNINKMLLKKVTHKKPVFLLYPCLLYTYPSQRYVEEARMASSD